MPPEEPPDRWLDPDGSLLARYQTAPQETQDPRGGSDGFAGFLVRHHGAEEVTAWLCGLFAAAVLGACARSAVGELGSSIARRLREGKAKRPWDAGAESEAVDRLDAALLASEPELALMGVVDEFPETTLAQIAAALSSHFRGDYLTAQGGLKEVLRECALKPDLASFVRWRLAKARGALGDVDGAIADLAKLTDVSSLKPVLQANVLREIAHWSIYQAWTSPDIARWSTVEEILTRQTAALTQLNRLHPDEARTRWLNASHEEFRAILGFARAPSLDRAREVEARLEVFAASDPTFGAFRQTPLAVLFMRAGDNRRAQEILTISRTAIRNPVERGLSLMVEAQACIRLAGC